MKKHFAVFDLFIRDSFYKILNILCAMVIVEAITWRAALQSGYTDFWSLLTRSPFGYVMAIAWILITIVLCYNGSTGNQNHLIRRLSIREEWFFIWQIFYNVLCYLLFWFVQAFMLYEAYQIFAAGAGAELVNHQTLMTICYRSPMYHAFFPLSDRLMLLRNLFLVLGMGTSCAVYSIHGRYHRKAVALSNLFAPILALTGIGFGFVRRSAVLVLGISAAIALISIVSLWTLAGRIVSNDL